MPYYQPLRRYEHFKCTNIAVTENGKIHMFYHTVQYNNKLTCQITPQNKYIR